MKKRLVIFISLLVSGCSVFFSNGNQVEAKSEQGNFKTIGYLPDYDSAYIEKVINFATLTDVNYFSLIPQKDGQLKFTESGSSEQLESLVKIGHKNQVRVGISIGGWGLSDNFAAATTSDQRALFIANIVSFVDRYKLDTVDIDWEYPAEEEAEQFASFIKELKTALGTTNLSICVPTGVASNSRATGRWELHFPPSALNAADWVNIMSYDAQILDYPHHSPVTLQKANLAYWNDLMGGDQMERLVGGLPFYAKAEDGSVLTYNGIVKELGQVPMADVVKLGGKDYYLNNKETIQQKVIDTIDVGALGVMIWAPTQDAALDDSSQLMPVIIETLKKKQVSLAKSEFAELAVDKQAKKGSKSWLLLPLLLLIGLSLSLMNGYLVRFLPTTINGKSVKSAPLGKLIGSVGLICASLGGLLLLTSVYVTLVVLAMFISCLYLVLKYT